MTRSPKKSPRKRSAIAPQTTRKAPKSDNTELMALQAAEAESAALAEATAASKLAEGITVDIPILKIRDK